MANTSITIQILPPTTHTIIARVANSVIVIQGNTLPVPVVRTVPITLNISNN